MTKKYARLGGHDAGMSTVPPTADDGSPTRRNPVLRALSWLPVSIVLLALVAAGPVAVYYSFEMRQKTEILTSRGQEADARVINSYRAGRRGVDIHADVIFTTAEGDIRSEHLLGCDSDLLSAEMVRVVYDPEDPSFLRPVDCAASHRLAWIVLALGLAFTAFDVVLIRDRWQRMRAR